MISSKFIVVGMLEGTYLHIPFHVCFKLSVVRVTKKNFKNPAVPSKNTQNPKPKHKIPQNIPTRQINPQNLWMEGSPEYCKTSRSMTSAKAKSGQQ